MPSAIGPQLINQLLVDFHIPGIMRLRRVLKDSALCGIVQFPADTISVRRLETLPPASFRFSLTGDTLALG